jgi:hypothetical protein
MVGEQAQEMQLAHWIPTTRIERLTNITPAWMGLWFSVFPTAETLSAQALAAVLVIGCYFAPRFRTPKRGQKQEDTSSAAAEVGIPQLVHSAK